MSLAPGTLLNRRYRIISVLGQGGMGSVYRAQDENLDVPVAVKENLFLSEEYGRQFQQEASILATLRHQNLPRVSDYFIIPGQGQYLIMDFIEGEDLRDRIERSGELPEREAALIGAAICDALTYLHNRRPQVIHRDIKPGNIKIAPDGTVALVDFGLAKVVKKDSQQTGTGARAMTPGYSPPEQYGSGSTDLRSDIYSLGATLYAALTGTIPEDAIARLTGKSKLTAIRQVSPHTNRRLAAVIMKAMEIDPDDRYSSAAEMKTALLQAAGITALGDEQIVVTPPPQSPEPIAEHRSLRAHPLKAAEEVQRRNWRTFVTGLIAILLLAVALIVRDPTGFSAPQANLFQTPTQQQTATLPLSTPDLTQTAVAALAEVTPSLEPSATPTTEPSPTVEVTEEVIAPPPIDEIAFASNRGGTMQIWLMNADGSGLRQLTTLPDGACQPAWSPEGSQLAFISPCEAKSETYPGAQIFTWELDSEDAPIPLPLSINPSGDFYPAWSPDGLRIAFTSLRIGLRPQIMGLNLTTGEVSRYSDGEYPDLQPTFSPDGSLITFIRRFAYTQVWTIPVEGGGAVRFTPLIENNHYTPTWSPDGSLLYASQSSGGVTIPRLVAFPVEDGRALQPIRIPANGSDTTGPVAGARVSSDGFWIAFESWPDGNNHDIYRMNPNGANRERLTDHPALDFGPAWRPKAAQPDRAS